MRGACLTLFAALLLAACGGDRAPVRPSPDEASLRLVTLAPHLAEIAVAAGAGSRLVGVSAFSDFPPSVAALPVVSDGFQVDAEALLAVRPTLVLGWGGGGQARSVALVEQLGVPFEMVATRSLADIAPAIRRVGELARTEVAADRAARSFERGIEALRFDGPRLRVFYQIGERPLYTVNGEHVISELIARCGGDNVFASLETLAPAVSVEAVVRADPDVILTATDAAAAARLWSRWPELAAVANESVLPVPGDLVNRPGPRLVQGGQAICDALALARRRRGLAGG